MALFEELKYHEPHSGVVADKWEGAAALSQRDREYIQRLKDENISLRATLEAERCAHEATVRELKSELRDYETGFKTYAVETHIDGISEDTSMHPYAVWGTND